MTAFEQTLLDVDRICQESQTPYAIIGGIANLIHGGARTTQDVDLTLFAEIDQLDHIYRLFELDFMPLHENALAFFQRFFVLPLRHQATQIRVDVAAGLSGLERRAIARSERRNFGEVEVSVCTVEDLILFKLFAAREKDLLDVKSLVASNRQSLDRNYLRDCARELIDLERGDVLQKLEALL